ncbi:MAG: hypothetical protein J5931_06975 [Prevotella sp.]|jgi:hypothetical protein|nr:hypothetical protein [Prevotella sp.]
MKFSFSSKFPQRVCRQLLRALGAEIDNYRLILGVNVTELMTSLGISHPIIKRY